MPGEDFHPVSGGLYVYEVQFSPDQQTMPAASIQIVNDLSAEENETFILSLTPGPDAALFNYRIPSSGRIATVLITDDDGKPYYM